MDIIDQNEPSTDSFDNGATGQRLRIFMLALITVGVVAGVSVAGWRMGLGIGLGGALSMFNERWLQASTRAIIEYASATGNPSVPKAAKFILRFVVMGVVIVAAAKSGYFNLLGIGIGFTAFVGAAMIEGAYQALQLKSGE